MTSVMDVTRAVGRTPALLAAAVAVAAVAAVGVATVARRDSEHGIRYERP